MPTTLWNATVMSIGDDAPLMFESGAYILFGHPVPEALADVSIVHEGSTPPAREIAPGDTFRLGAASVRIDEVGERAHQNLTDLGHVVIYVDMPEQNLLPGAIKASGGPLPEPAAGDRLEFVAED